MFLTQRYRTSDNVKALCEDKDISKDYPPLKFLIYDFCPYNDSLAALGFI